jgi:TIR domain
MPKIAISYRRADSSAIAGRIFDRLAAHYGEHSVFMDIDNIPLGVDFRSHIRETLQRSDVLIAIIGANWLGLGADGVARMNDSTDPIRLEIETALRGNTPVIPVLVDGVKMPDSAALPAEFGNFAFLNAADVSSGRDFRTHMERLINAVDQILAGGASVAFARPLTTAGRVAAANTGRSIPGGWGIELLRYVAIPLVLLLVAHYAILINNLDNRYIWLAATVIPFAFGFAFSALKEHSAAFAITAAIALGLFGVAGMTTSESMISGDPILPQGRIEWLDNLQFAAAIALGFLAGHVLARAAHTLLRRKFKNT